MKSLLTLLSLSALLFATGCASTDEVVLDSVKRSQTTSVEVFKEGSTLGKPYKEIAELSFLGPREDELRAQKFFVDRARKLGGNGIIFTVVMAGQKSGGSMYGFHSSTAWLFKGRVIA